MVNLLVGLDNEQGIYTGLDKNSTGYLKGNSGGIYERNKIC